MKKINLILLFLLLFLNACSGSKSLNEKANEKDEIVIIYGTQAVFCDIIGIMTSLDNTIVYSTSHNTKCSSFGREKKSILNPTATCYENTLDLFTIGKNIPLINGIPVPPLPGKEACVIAGNKAPSS